MRIQNYLRDVQCGSRNVSQKVPHSKTNQGLNALSYIGPTLWNNPQSSAFIAFFAIFFEFLKQDKNSAFDGKAYLEVRNFRGKKFSRNLFSRFTT